MKVKLVRVHKLDSKAKDTSVGILYVSSPNGISCYPKDNRILQELSRTDFFVDMNTLSPEEYLGLLHKHYQSGYLRVGPVEESELRVA